MTRSKSQMDLNMRNLEEVIGKCDFKGTASAFSQTLRELIESYNDKRINSEEYSKYMDMAEKMLNENKCTCRKEIVW